MFANLICVSLLILSYAANPVVSSLQRKPQFKTPDIIPLSRLNKLMNKNDILPKKRVVSIGSIYGDYDNAIKVLQLAGLANNEGHWIGGNATLVHTGNLIDFMPDTIKLFKLMKNLKLEAEQKGGRVIHLLGSHELMNIQNFTYQAEDWESFGHEFMEQHRKRKLAFSKTGEFGKYIRELDVIAEIDGTVYSHSGPSPKYAKYGVENLNTETSKYLQGSFISQMGSFGEFGPIHYRGFAYGSESEICEKLDESLKLLNAKRMVIGQKMTNDGRIQSKCNGKLFMISTGLSSRFGSNLAALEIQDDKITPIYPLEK